jgi:hypothetical protein
MTGGWREARPELVIAVLTVAAVSGAAFAFAGAAGAVITLAGAGVTGLVVLRFLAPPGDTAPFYEQPEDGRTRTTFSGFWRRRAGVQAATQSMSGYDFGLRHTLQHLLAARLAERHGISLYDDPEAARRLLAGGGSDRLWYWLDPARPAVSDEGRSGGIPPRTLAAILDRLERL